jgi:hypothetical protein
MTRMVSACLLMMVFLAPAATANSSGTISPADTRASSLGAALPALTLPGVQNHLEALVAVAVFAPGGGVRGLANGAAHVPARCGSGLAFSPESSCLAGCDAAKETCERKCNTGLNTCLTQCPMLGFACDAYCRAATVVCHGYCTRDHDSCVGACPTRGSGESKGMVTKPAFVQ